MQIPEGLPTWVLYLSPFYWSLISIPAILVISLAIGYRFGRDGRLVLGREDGKAIRLAPGLSFFGAFALSILALNWIANALQSVVSAWAFVQFNYRLAAQVGFGSQRTWQPDLLLVALIEALALAAVVSVIVAPARRPQVLDPDEVETPAADRVPPPTRAPQSAPRLTSTQPR